MRIWRTLLRAVLALAVATVVVTYAKFWLWRAEITRGLQAHSTVVQTARGPIEYAAIGTGYPGLYLHGTPGGYDQVYNATKLAIERGQPQLLRVIAPSRPGYLRTPLSVGATPEQQAEGELLLKSTYPYAARDAGLLNDGTKIDALVYEFVAAHLPDSTGG